MRILAILLALVITVILSLAAYHGWQNWNRADLAEALGLLEVDNGDAQFWLMQGPPNNRYIPGTVIYYFDQQLDQSLVLNRLKDLVASYQMFKRNITEVDGLPYWQMVEPDWEENFHWLSAEEDMDALRVAADAALSQAQQPGKGIPLFRAYLSADGRQLTFIRMCPVHTFLFSGTT